MSVRGSAGGRKSRLAAWSFGAMKASMGLGWPGGMGGEAMGWKLQKWRSSSVM